MGFCRQHLPIAKTDRSKWKGRLEGAALVVSAAELFIKIVEIALKYLVELKGPGDEQTRARREIKKDFPPFYPRVPKSYVAGSWVDWTKLLSAYTLARELQHQPGQGALSLAELEERFDDWFSSLDPFRKEQLLEGIEDCLKLNGSDESGDDQL